MTAGALPGVLGRVPWRYVGARLGQSAVVLWAAYTLTFIVLFLLPGDAVSVMLGSQEAAERDPALEAELRARYQLDQPPLVQYFVGLWAAVRLDLGVSVTLGQPVTELIAQALPLTAQIAAGTLLLSLLLGLTIAVTAVYVRSPVLKNALLALPGTAVAIPTFWIGLLLLQFLSFRLPVFPAGGSEGPLSLVLPTLTLTLPISGMIAQILTKSLLETWREPYIPAIRSKGLSRLQLLLRHALPNAVIPAVTMAGIITGNLLAGSVVTETVFSRDGIGRLAQIAVINQDIPLVQGIVLLAAFIFVAVNLLVDLAYPLIDPRIRMSREVTTADEPEPGDGATTPAEILLAAGPSQEEERKGTRP